MFGRFGCFGLFGFPTLQDDSKRHLRSSQNGPRGPQDGPKTAQEGSKMAQEASKTAQEAPKKDGSKRGPRRGRSFGRMVSGGAEA